MWVIIRAVSKVSDHIDIMKLIPVSQSKRQINNNFNDTFYEDHKHRAILKIMGPEQYTKRPKERQSTAWLFRPSVLHGTDEHLTYGVYPTQNTIVWFSLSTPPWYQGDSWLFRWCVKDGGSWSQLFSFSFFSSFLNFFFFAKQASPSLLVLLVIFWKIAWSYNGLFHFTLKMLS